LPLVWLVNFTPLKSNIIDSTTHSPLLPFQEHCLQLFQKTLSYELFILFLKVNGMDTYTLGDVW